MCCWKHCIILLIYKLKVEMLCKIDGDVLQVCFSKCFPKADTFASSKWSPACRIPFLTSSCQADWIGWVKSLWNELIRSLPFFSIVVECIYGNKEFVTFPNSHVPDSGVLSEFKVACIFCWRLDPQGFHNHPIQVLHIIDSLKCHHFTQEFGLVFH